MLNVRMLLLGLVCLNLVACGGNTATVKNKDIPPAPKADFQKAAMLNVEMGDIYLRQGQMTRAKSKFVHALELKPNLPEAHSSIGYFYEIVGEIEEAEKHHKSAISYGEGKGRFYNNYGTFLCRQGRYKEADRAFNNAIKDKQYLKVAEVYENAGMCMLNQPNIEKAYEYFQTALKRDPSRVNASLELANMELNRNNLAGAITYLNNFKSNSNPSPRSLLLGIKINKKLGNKDEVASAALQLKNLYPKSNEYKQYLELNQNG